MKEMLKRKIARDLSDYFKQDHKDRTEEKQKDLDKINEVLKDG